MKPVFRGVLPAVTTPFTPALAVDHERLASHVAWLLEAGCDGVVPVGSLGEGATLSHDERLDVVATCVRAADGRAPVLAGIAAASTADAVRLAQEAAARGCDGLMVLPPHVYSSDGREMRAHVGAVLSATPLPCMLYNNPIAYRTDFRLADVGALAASHGNLVAIKESSDLVVEGVAAGATGWVAGLVNALPHECVALFRLASEGRQREAADLYRWFLPLLRMDTVPKFVQLIKLVQEDRGRGSRRVRPPRLDLEGDELVQATATIARAMAARPDLSRVP
jgi:4-hydroxy-tetrahydrodipicolinate synthase